MVTENDLEKIEFALYVLQHPEIRGKMEVREWLESGKHRDLLEELRRFREAWRAGGGYEVSGRGETMAIFPGKDETSCVENVFEMVVKCCRSCFGVSCNGYFTE